MNFFLNKIKLFFQIENNDIIHLLLVGGVIALLDLLTKDIVFSLQSNAIYVLSIFNIVKVKNFGISFGLFNENPDIMFYVILIIDVVIIMYLLHCLQTKKNYNKPKLFITSLSFIIGGAVGNFIDRLFTGSVRDFIDFHIGSSHWPCFNVADSFICIGVGIWIICEFFFRNKIVK